MQPRLTRRVDLVILTLAACVGLLNLVGLVALQNRGLLDAIARPEFYILFLFVVFFAFDYMLPEKVVQWIQTALILLLSGPVTLSSPFAFYGMWFFVLGLILAYKYGFLNHWTAFKLIVVGLFYLPFLIFSVLTQEGGENTPIRVASYFIFLASCLAFLYFIFEEEIRDLLASNKSKEKVLAAKDTELAVQAATIARLEPLSVLGERVAHVAHSFKNQLNQISTVVFFLEQLHDEKRAVDKLQDFTKTVNERIENILMMSRSGVDLEPESFDVARLLEGLRQVYLSERSFSEHATTELTVDGPWMVTTVRWDFILMVENILKNALEAIVEKGGHGTIRIDLAAGRLTLANDGGAIPLCDDCPGSCLNCKRYGSPGQTHKKGGSGHGLAQVFGTCRRNGWGLRMRTSGSWTIFEITLTSSS